MRFFRSTLSLLLLGFLAAEAGPAMACGNGKLLFEDKFETLDPAWGFRPAAELPNRSTGPDGLVYKFAAGEGSSPLNEADLYTDYEVCAVFSTKVPAAKAETYVAVGFWASDTENSYWAYILPAPGWGTFGVNRLKNNKTLRPVEETRSAAVHKGLDVTNEISVTVKGNKATVAINGTKVIDFTGSAPEGGSVFGFNMAAGDKDRGTSTVTLKNIQLRALEEAEPSEAGKQPSATQSKLSPENRRDCDGSDPDKKIAGCTAEIESGQATRINLAIAYNHRGLAYADKGQYDRAIADFDRSIELEPNEYVNYHMRGLVYQNKGEHDRAIADFDRAIKLKPNDAVPYLDRASSYSDKEDYERAIADIDKAIKIDPKSSRAFSDRGLVYANKGQYDRAIADYDRSIALNPKNAIAYNNRGSAYDGKEEYDRAVVDYDRSIELDPKDAATYSNRGLAYSHKGQYDRAIADYDRAIKLNPDATYFYNRARAYQAKGEHERAIADFDQTIKLKPEGAAAYVDRAVSYSEKRDYDRAIADADQAIKIDPRSAFAFVARGRFWNNKGESVHAIADLDHALSIDPTYATAYVNRALVYRNKGDYDRAIADYDQVIRLEPKDADGYSQRGYARYSKGDFKEAAADLLRSLKLQDWPRPMLVRYLALARTGKAAAPELEANAGRLKTKEWPYAVIELYLGKRTPEATLDAAAKPDDRCEAQLFIGEWHLLKGNRAEAEQALKIAADTCPKQFAAYSIAIAELKRLKSEGTKPAG